MVIPQISGFNVVGKTGRRKGIVSQQTITINFSGLLNRQTDNTAHEIHFVFEKPEGAGSCVVSQSIATRHDRLGRKVRTPIEARGLSDLHGHGVGGRYFETNSLCDLCEPWMDVRIRIDLKGGHRQYIYMLLFSLTFGSDLKMGMEKSLCAWPAPTLHIKARRVPTLLKKHSWAGKET